MTTPQPASTSLTTPSSGPASERVGWKLVWHDEFDGPELDLKNWTFDLGGGGWGNQEWQVYTDQPQNVRVEQGMLVIEARKQEAKEGEHPYSSARIKTQGLYAWQYGRVEARLKLPYGQGIWPAFWMLGEDITQKGWPACGEIDIMEHMGKEPDHIYAAVHAPGYSGDHCIGSSFTTSTDSLRSDFHVYAMEWDENEICWYFDDQQYFKISPEQVPKEWGFDHPFFIILNLAIGGLWPGYPDETTLFPQSLYADYVRVYQRIS